MMLTIPPAILLPIRRLMITPRLVLAALCGALVMTMAAVGMSGCCCCGPEMTIVNRCSFPVVVQEPDVPDWVLAAHSQHVGGIPWDDVPEIGDQTGVARLSVAFLANGRVIERVSGPAQSYSDPELPDGYIVYVSDIGDRPYQGIAEPENESVFDASVLQCGFAASIGLCLYLLWMRGYIARRIPCCKPGLVLTRAKLGALPPDRRRGYATVCGLTVLAAYVYALAMPVLIADIAPASVRLLFGVTLIAAWHALNYRWACLRDRVRLLTNLP